MASLEIAPLESVAPEEVVNLVSGAFKRELSLDWFRWKHEENPYGKSLGWVALDGSQVVGARLMLRWKLTIGDSPKVVRALRPVDTATAVDARGKGIFRSLTEHATAIVQNRGHADLIFNTPNEFSLGGYRQLGWIALPLVRYSYHAVTPRQSASLVEDETVLSDLSDERPPNRALTTLRSLDYLKWRYDDRSGYHYQSARLRDSNQRCGLVYRLSRQRGLNVVVVCELAGSTNECRVLIRSVARRHGAFVAMSVQHERAVQPLGGVSIKRGGSIVAVKKLREIDPDPTRSGSWRFTVGDLEGVI